MNARSLYLDTSIIGGYFDTAFQDATKELWHQMHRGTYRFFTSVVTEQEIVLAPQEVRSLFHDTFATDDLLSIDREGVELAHEYVRCGVVTPKYLSDARHVAVCSLARIPYLASWNFKHLANIQREAGFNAVNLLQGYSPVRIVSPMELIYGT